LCNDVERVRRGRFNQADLTAQELYRRIEGLRLVGEASLQLYSALLATPRSMKRKDKSRRKKEELKDCKS
jgi:hypothetical protein